MLRSIRSIRSLGAEEALGEGSDEADLDDEAQHRLTRSQDSHRIAQADALRKEAASVEGCEAEDERLVPLERVVAALGLALNDPNVSPQDQAAALLVAERALVATLSAVLAADTG